MRVLVLGPEEREAAHRLALFAARPENQYRPGPDATVPGDDPRFCIRLGVNNDFRCVFTYTVHEGLWRHLSVSVSDPMKAPNPAAVVEIAHLFGFKGTLKDWQISLDRLHGAVVVLQQA